MPRSGELLSLSPWERLGEGIEREQTVVAKRHPAMFGTRSYLNL